MNFRASVKDIVYRISPACHIAINIRKQLEGMQDLLLERDGNNRKLLEETQNMLLERDANNRKLLEEMQNLLFNVHSKVEDVRNANVYIRDYSNYVPKHRSSLAESKIGEIMENWYCENKNEVIELFRNFCSFREFYKNIPVSSNPGSPLPQWENEFIQPLDAISIYGFLAINNPRYFVEVGSGNTTLFAAQSIQDNNLRTEIISIDPFPRAGIDEICGKIFRMPLEDMDIDFFSTLSCEDILLLDDSHRSFPNSDVTVFFTEILPKLPPGMLYAIHDIYLPWDYPEQWSCTERRWYNEQYLLCAYLLGGAGRDKIMSPNWFLGEKEELFEACGSLWGKGELLEKFWFGGVFFWLKRQ